LAPIGLTSEFCVVTFALPMSYKMNIF